MPGYNSRVLDNPPAAHQLHMTVNRTLLLFLLVSVPAPAVAQQDANVQVNGFLLGNFAGRTMGWRPTGEQSSDFLLAEERVRMDLNAWSESVEASTRAKIDFFHDGVLREFDLDIREAYVDYTTGDFDFRLGRQIITWGVGDLLFINDVFPKDWVSFFSGRPLEYLKIGVDGLRTHYSGSAFNAELAVIPFFTPDNFPSADRFALFDPFATVPVRVERLPDKTYSNTELALRLYRRIGGFDLSLYAYRGFFGSPSFRPDSLVSASSVTIFYPALSTYGLSGQKQILRGVLSFELGYYYSRDDPDGGNPAVPNSTFRFLAGFQRQLSEDLVLGIQYYGEVMADYDTYVVSLPAVFHAQKRYQDTATIRLDRLLKHQTWRLSLFVFFSAVDLDYLIQPQASYKFSDDFSATVGANVFGGDKRTTFLGQLDENDNIYLSVRFDL